MAAFLHIADHLVREPLLISEGMEKFTRDSLGFYWRLQVDRDRAFQAWRTHWLVCWAGLAGGDLWSYVQVPSSGRYARVPREYWIAYDKERLDPSSLEHFAEAHGFESSMIGAPLLLWKPEFEEWSIATRNRVAALAVDDPAKSTEPRPPEESLPERRGEEQRRLASVFDARGIARRDLRAADISAEWDRACGPIPDVQTIAGLMSKKKGGRPTGA